MDRQTTAGAADLTSEAVERGDPDLLDTLTGWAGRQQSGNGELADRGRALRTALARPGGPATAGVDELGPLPAPCSAPVADPTPAPGATGEAPGSSAAAPPTTAAAPTPDAVPTPTSAPGGPTPSSSPPP